jgi:hypothetical protein
MMITALAVAAASIISTPITIEMHAPGISSIVVTTAVQEATAIWRAAGLEISWCTSGIVRVTIDDAPSVSRDSDKVIGYVTFTDAIPEPDVHLSFDNALTLLAETEGPGVVGAMTRYERDSMLGRALGKALAHELGHFLLGRDHTATGLMKAHRRTPDLFKRGREGFEITAAQRAAVASRLSQLLARR